MRRPTFESLKLRCRSLPFPLKHLQIQVVLSTTFSSHKRLRDRNLRPIVKSALGESPSSLGIAASRAALLEPPNTPAVSAEDVVGPQRSPRAPRGEIFIPGHARALVFVRMSFDPAPNATPQPAPPRPGSSREIRLFLGIVTGPAQPNFGWRHSTRPHHRVIPDEIIRLTRMVPIANGRIERYPIALLRQSKFRLTQRRHDLGAATAAATVARGVESLRDVENPLLELLRDKFHVARVHHLHPHCRSSLVSPCVATV